MAAQAGTLRARKPARRFLLTPLVDVIFLLVIFFAMSSRIAPFVTLPIATGGAEPAQAAPRGAAKPAETLILSRGHVRTGGKTLTFEEFPAAARAMRAAGIDGVTLLPSRSATTQDVVDALQALDRAEIATVRLLSPVVASDEGLGQ
ncbi:ExbD/TolR family protein [Jiella marina]|uniref:ExbD/TolR family protein n=1 Tax=Jiella sp. LLJ827 TaxID=2917712 RepID=UPI002100FEA0|nr:biopolymer transporter ExbD [Jiella sp. LLJ827]MCQ0990460.1 biopolymer transporter ExbD [Jiella sp. LLJ827]